MQNGSVWNVNAPHQSWISCPGAQGPGPFSPPPRPGLLWPLGKCGPSPPHPLLPLQLFPPTRRALTSSRAHPGGAFPSPSEGPLGPRAPAHPFPVPPQLRPDLGWKVSLKMGGSFSFLPGGPGTTKASWRVGEGRAPRSPARGEVTRPPSQTTVLARPAPPVRQPRRWREDSHSLVGKPFFHSGVFGATCRRSAGPHFPETPLSPRPRARHSEHKNAERVFIYLRAQESGP